MGINLKQADSGTSKEFDSIPEGWYIVAVDRAELQPTSSGGAMIKTTFKVEGPNHKGRLVWNNFNLGATSLWALKKFLSAAGSDMVDRENITEKEIADGMGSLRAEAYLVPDTTNTGKPTNKITDWKASETGGVVAFS